MAVLNKLELTWIGKYDEQLNVEPRILIQSKNNSYGSPSTGVLSNGKPWGGNMIIHGDNLLALRALEGHYANSVKCVYIDPPYNTGAAFEHYDDNLEHSIWLNLMRARLQILHNLISPDGAIAVQIDAVEMAYLKVLLDEVFHRNNFINIITVKTKIAGVSGSNLGKSLQDNTEYILLYAKDLSKFQINVVPQKKQELMEYIDSYTEQGKSWKYTSVLTDIDEGEYLKSFPAGNGDEIKLYKHSRFTIKSVKQIANEEFGGDIKKAYYGYIDRVFRTTNAQTSIRTKVIEETSEYGGEGLFTITYVPIKGKNAGKESRFFYKDNNLVAWLKDVVSVDGKRIIKLDNSGNLWDDIQYNNLTKEGDVQFPNGKKPEALVKRIIEMISLPGDLVLDSFLGSGTTCAVAQKLGRRYIGVELGDHAFTHCVPRLKRVTDGEDTGGITEEVQWKGGEGFKFYELAPSLLKKDAHGNLVINKEYNADMLASAMASHEGFTYSPSSEVFWKQGYSSENDFIYTTTQFLNVEAIAAIEETMAEGESLLICCKAFQPECKNASSRITLKKIPSVLLGKCEFDRDDYSLNVVDMPTVDQDEDDDYVVPGANDVFKTTLF